MLYSDFRTVFWKPNGELMNSSCEGYIELISDGFLPIPCLCSICLVALFQCRSDTLWQWQHSFIAIRELFSSNHWAASWERHWCALSFPPSELVWHKIKIHTCKIKVRVVHDGFDTKFKYHVINSVGYFALVSRTFLLVSSLKSFPLYLNYFFYINSEAHSSLLECRLWAKPYQCPGCGSQQNWENSLIPSSGK